MIFRSVAGVVTGSDPQVCSELRQRKQQIKHLQRIPARNAGRYKRCWKTLEHLWFTVPLRVSDRPCAGQDSGFFFGLGASGAWLGFVADVFHGVLAALILLALGAGLAFLGFISGLGATFTGIRSTRERECESDDAQGFDEVLHGFIFS